MNRPDLYNKTVDILYKAYFDDTLEHSNCAACAVGNIIAARNNYKVMKGYTCWRGQNDLLVSTSWDNVFFTGYGKQVMYRALYKDDARREIDSTGYELDELAKIEFAFESCEWLCSPDEYMFNGLVAVLDALAQIHEVTDQDLISNNSKRFSDHYKTLSPCPATNAII